MLMSGGHQLYVVASVAHSELALEVDEDRGDLVTSESAVGVESS